MAKTINLTLKIWRKQDQASKGRFETYEMKEVNTDVSFLEMLDLLNTDLELKGEEPVAFDHDCREGICGMCGAIINGQAHGPDEETTLCQLHMRRFNDGDVLVIEPWRAKAFPNIKDLVVDRTALDRIISAGGFISVRTGQAPDAHAVAVQKVTAEQAMDAAQCIGCGACVAACPNAAAMLFTSAKMSQLNILPQGKPEKDIRSRNMVDQMDKEGFGNCTNHYECEAACPKLISVKFIARMNRDHLATTWK
ncbi:MAG: succinate dehydrogenase/fumarate reductase iron-sulfur subunit [Planctomycetota bacterium]|jgi:succinate dehydrogenase / fumarate reductase iron-sulfur subunit